MSALVAELRALALRDTPVVLPVPQGTACPSAESTSSSLQRFAHVGELGYVLHVPDLVHRVVDHAFAYIDRRLDQVGRTTSSGLLPTTKAKVDAALRNFETSRLDDYAESRIQDVLRDLLLSLAAVVADCDLRLAIPQADPPSSTRATAWSQVPIPSHDPQGRKILTRVIPDVTLYRVVDGPNKVEEPVVTIELKTPHASLGIDEPCTSRSGLFVRAVDAVAQAGGVRWTEIREDPAVSSLLKKEIVAARTYGHDLVIFADGFSYFIGVVVQVEPHLYHVLVSDLERLAPPAPSTSLYYAVHVAAFYTKLAEMAQHFRVLAINLAATAARAGPAADPAVEHSRQGVAERREPGEQGAGYRRSMRRSGGDTGVGGSKRSLLKESINLTYPNGSSTTAQALIASPSASLRSSTSSANSNASTLPSSTTSTASSLQQPSSLVQDCCREHPASLPSSTAAAAAVHLCDLLATSSRARIYTCTLDDEPYVVKISRGEGADELEHEALLLARSDVRALGDDVVRAEAAFCTADGRIVLVERDGGDALEMWDDLTEPQRISLVLSVLRLHQLGHLFHGDLAPRNVVVPPPSSSPSSPSTSTASPPPAPKARLIDLGHAYEHDQPCAGRECAEVRQLVRELALEPPELDDVGRRAADEGLVW